MRVALAHDYLVQGMRGAERVLAAIYELWPGTPVYTLVYDPEAMGPPFTEWDVRPSFLQKLPGGVRHYQKLIALMPRAVERLPLSEYDLIISDSSAWVKSLRAREDAVHVCYCHSPARFLWHWADEYMKSAPGNAAMKWVAGRMIPRLRAWDLRTSGRPTHYVANSETVRQRIKRYWDQESTVIHPPVDTSRFAPEDHDGEHFLVVSALNPYKSVDLVIEAFNELGLPLVVVGDGPQWEELNRLAGTTVHMAGKVSEEELQHLYARCRAYVMPQEEDFGLAPVEAMSAGRPVVAYGVGGALETVIDGETGLLFEEQTVPSLVEAVGRFERMDFAKGRCRERALEFDTERFQQRFREFVDAATSEAPT